MGTHGRSIYKADISALQQLTPDVMEKGLHLFTFKDIKHSKGWGNASYSWGKADTPGLDMVFYSKEAGDYSVNVKTSDGITVSSTLVPADRGLNIVSYDVTFSKKGKIAYQKKYKRELKIAKDGKTYLPLGTYSVELEGGGNKVEEEFHIKE
ncbi:MAG: hypothetical protein AAF361_03625 [Bacteroidota bacterium]